eukprot:2646518-Rhodomonas_salina.1
MQEVQRVAYIRVAAAEEPGQTHLLINIKHMTIADPLRKRRLIENQLWCVCQPIQRWHEPRIIEVWLAKPHLDHPVIQMARVKQSVLAVRQSRTLLWKLCVCMRSIAIEMADHPLIHCTVPQAWRYCFGAMETNCLNERETSCEPKLFLLQAPWPDLHL